LWNPPASATAAASSARTLAACGASVIAACVGGGFVPCAQKTKGSASAMIDDRRRLIGMAWRRRVTLFWSARLTIVTLGRR